VVMMETPRGGQSIRDPGRDPSLDRGPGVQP
jgi:hypothetical protein